jgi:Resolvase, N terminal domain
MKPKQPPASSSRPPIEARNGRTEDAPHGSSSSRTRTPAAPGAAGPDDVKAILYSRVALGDGSGRPYQLQAQTNLLRAWVDRQRWTIVGEFEDMGSGLRIGGRPGLARAIALARETGGVLLTTDLDRLARDRDELARLVRDDAEREGWAVLPLNLAAGEASDVHRLISLLVAPPLT